MDNYICKMPFRRDRFREIREKYGSREKLAGAINSTGTTIYNWETSEAEPSLYGLEKAAKIMGTTLAYFMDETDDPSPNALKGVPEITEDEAAILGYRARGKDWDDLLPTDEMELALQELAAIRRIRLLQEAERKKGSANTTGGSSES
jgi:transcriptional regulator with XRE-family HTH domain